MEFERHSKDCDTFGHVVWHTCKFQGKEVADWTEESEIGWSLYFGAFDCNSLERFKSFCANTLPQLKGKENENLFDWQSLLSV